MRSIFLFTVCCITLNAYAQYPQDWKSDYNWCFGYGSVPQRPTGRSLLSFNGVLFDTSWHNHYQKTLHETNSSISDSNGDLLFYTNGFEIIGSNHQTIANGDSINCVPDSFYCNVIAEFPNCCGPQFDTYYTGGQPVIQGAITLPFHNESNSLLSKFFVIHKPFDFTSNNWVVSYDIRLSIVGYQNGNLVCLKKDSIVMADTIQPGYVTACRHANGRDWWVIQQRLNKKKYFSFLVTPNGMELKHTIQKGIYVKQNLGQRIFTPDGTKYIEVGISDFVNNYQIQIFNFDRCTGLLSSPQLIEFTDSSGSVSSSAAVSPNSRYLYVASRFKVWQFDLQAQDILASKITVAEYDGFLDPLSPPNWPLPTVFVWMQLAPDNKIYICGGNNTYLHTIDNPDEPGLACNVNQHSFRMPSFNAYSMPNFPNFRLGPIDGSACDTLGIDNLTNLNDKLDNNTEPVKIYPNPATDYITLFVPRLTKAWQFALYDIQGREVLHVNSRGAFRSINISHLAQGMYLWKLVYEDGKVENGKMVKQ